MEKYKKVALALFILAILSKTNSKTSGYISPEEEDRIMEERCRDLYNQGYYDRYNHSKPDLKDYEDYMEGYKDGEKYRYS